MKIEIAEDEVDLLQNLLRACRSDEGWTEEDRLLAVDLLDQLEKAENVRTVEVYAYDVAFGGIKVIASVDEVFDWEIEPTSTGNILHLKNADDEDIAIFSQWDRVLIKAKETDDAGSSGA